jgi:hypothetical protein
MGGIILGIYILQDSPKPTPSPEESALTEEIERLKLRIDPPVWKQIESQDWFDDGKPTADGLRLMKLLANYYIGRRLGDALQLVRSYPTGLAATTETTLLNLESGDLIRMIATRPWFTQGLDANEEAYLSILAGAWARKGPGWTFDQSLIDSMKAPWFVDGLDEKEAVVINAAGALSSRNQEKAIELMRGIETNLFLYEAVTLPASGEKTLIVTTPVGDFQRHLQPALASIKQWMVAIEGFVGPYNPQYVLVAVEELSQSLCGTASGQMDDVPGFVRLHIGCIQDGTVIHELAHAFLGTGPVWFAEGAADLVVYHITGEAGSYLSRSGTGKMTASAVNKPELGSPEYLNQGALGARLFVDIYRLLGPDVTSSVMKEISSGKWPKETPVLTQLFLDAAPAGAKQSLTAIFADRIEGSR